MKALLKQWPWATLCTLAVTILSIIPIPDNPPLEGVPFIDKWVHFVMYGGIVCALWLDHWRQKRAAGAIFILCTLLFTALIGGLMEIVQSYTTYRSGDWIDFYADVFGALLATPLCMVLYRLWLGKKQ